MSRVCTVVAAALLLAGCVQPAPTPSMTIVPTPTFLCTPEAGGAEAPCSELQHREMQKRDALYAEAEQVYQTYQREYVKALKSGGAESLSAPLQDVLGSADVKDLVLAEVRRFKRDSLRIKGPSARLQKVSRLPGVTREGSEVAAAFCSDSRGTRVYQGSRLISRGILGVETVFFKTVQGALRIVYIEGERVQECDD